MTRPPVRAETLIVVLCLSMVVAVFGAGCGRASAPDPTPPPPSAAEPVAEIFAPGVISTDGFELGVSFAPDGRTVYFASIGSGFETSVIMTSSLGNDGWSEPRALSFAGRHRDLDPSVSADGTRMFFQSDRPTSGAEPKDWDIWVSDWTPEGWSEPRNLGAPINTPATETYPVVTGDGALYFSSDREGGFGEGDVYRSAFLNGNYLEPENLGPPINGSGFDSNAFVSYDESTMIFSSDSLMPHLGGGDLYVSYQRDGVWSAPVPVPYVNTPAREFAPALAPGSGGLFFTRDQRDPAAGPVVLGDLYRIEWDALGLPPAHSTRVP